MRFIPLVAIVLFASPASAADRPNVLIIVADDLRTDLGCYGSPAVTPNIDRLAARGVLFNRAYCQQALCNPSRSSFLTGKRPDTLRHWSNGAHFRDRYPDVVTLPQHFKQSGYVSRNVGKIFHNWHTAVKGDPRSWSAPEFLHYANHGSDAAAVTDDPPANTAPAAPRAYGDVPLYERRDVADEAYFDGRVAAEAVRVLGELKDRPFFLAVGFWKPHAPMNAPKKYWDLYDPGKLPRLDPARPAGAPELAFHDSREVAGIPPKQVTFTAAQAAQVRHGYLANISYMDAQVGKVLDTLDKHGLAANTVVVFVADHGYHTGEHSLWGKTSNFELDARVPLIIAPPEAKNAGARTESLAELTDLFPTLTELCGLPQPDGLDGVSLAPVLADPSKAMRAAALTQHPRPAYYDRTPKGVPDAMGYSVRTPTLRYTEWRDWETGRVLARELYDHTRDAAETTNVIENPPAGVTVADAVAELHRLVPPSVPPSKR